MSGPAPSYRERLIPTIGWFVAAIAIGASFGLVLLPLAGNAGLAVGALAGAAVAVGILVVTSARVEVTGGRLHAGRASIPVALLGPAEVVHREEMARLRGPGIDPRAYLCQRAWVRAGVKVGVRDASDPTPYWLISSQHPEQLADAIEAQRRQV
jgi:Protein of unknown function (DUF3093)